jgi:hypothetical protein
VWLTHRQITTGFAALFALCWMGLLVQKIHLCASDKSWYKSHSPQQCHLGKGVIAFQLVSASVVIYARGRTHVDNFIKLMFLPMPLWPCCQSLWYAMLRFRPGSESMLILEPHIAR